MSLRALPGGSHEVLVRGVFLAPFTIRGCLALIAVDHRGELRAQRPVPPEWPLVRAMGALEAWLDAKYPVPQIQLVEPTAPPTPAPIDPRNYMTRAQEEITYGWKRRRAQKLPIFR